MDNAHERPGFYDDVAELQMESVAVIALFATAIGSAWITLLISPVVFESAPVSAWIGGCLLILSGVLSRRLKDHYLPVAVHVLVWGTLGATACAVDAFPFPAALHLFILPVIFASLLLSQRAFFLVPTTAAALALTLGLTQVEMLYRLADLLIPLVIILLVALASRLSLQTPPGPLAQPFLSSPRRSPFARPSSAHRRERRHRRYRSRGCLLTP